VGIAHNLSSLLYPTEGQKARICFHLEDNLSFRGASRSPFSRGEGFGSLNDNLSAQRKTPEANFRFRCWYAH
jgi:hypothetical protein